MDLPHSDIPVNVFLKLFIPYFIHPVSSLLVTLMSFAVDLEAQDAPSSPQSELDVIISNTSEQIQTFGTLMSQFNAQRKHVGSRRDNMAFRDSVDALESKISALSAAIKTLLMNVNAAMSGKLEVSNRQLVAKERLSNEFRELANAFTASQRQYADAKRNVPVRADIEPSGVSRKASNATETTPLVQTQVDQDTIDATELQYHMLLSEERQREISRVSEGIREVNSIFKDLGQLVSVQGEQLDTIEDNILQMHGNTQQASRELQKAHEYQKRRGKWSCILLIFLCVFVLVVVLAVLS